MNGYTVFLGPFAGTVISDYYMPCSQGSSRRSCYVRPRREAPNISSVVSRLCARAHRTTFQLTHIRVPSASRTQNWRAALALLVSATPLSPGFVNSINPKIPIGGASRLFTIAWFFGFFVASAVYATTSLFFPARETFLADEEVEKLRERDVEVEEVDKEFDDGA